ncbi:MAG TPA: S8 family serine peptidase [Verrucomicrobiota bacterium]|nr:S8 family serine peptidase [Verrucomicrobiota bacterium]
MCLVFAELAGEPAADVSVRLRGLGLRRAELAGATRARIAEIAVQQDALVARLGQVGGAVEARFSRLANAIKVRLPLGQVERLRQLDGVVDVQPVVQFHPLTSTSVPFIGATNVWNRGKFSATGKGVRIGIIDSGIDYTHAMFGGSGKVADYTKNNPARIEKGTFPTAKVVGGYDFAGDAYDGMQVPQPDDDPLDCEQNSHGSHVAGIAGGIGVLTNGVPYTGGYGVPLDMGKFLAGPGVAPEAKLYALKVFGCSGTTGLSVDAMEWAADPDADGDLADRLDVVNLSLGSAYAHPGFENNVAARLSKLGCAVVRAAGNSGNNFYALMSYDDSEITVANSMDDGIENNSIEVTDPPPVREFYEAVEAAFTQKLSDAGEIAGRVVYADPPRACEELKNGDAIAGNIAMIDRGVCFFLDKIQRAKDAGARAVLIVNNEGGPPIPMGTTGGTVDIPAMMITLRDGKKLKEQLAAGLFVRLGGDVMIGGVQLADQLSPGSSRGPVYESHNLKPDLAAPGFNIHSAQAGGGSAPMLSGGTSMAAPHAAGAVALLIERHPDWTPSIVKAALMNTAVQTRDENGASYPETRTGAGRVNPRLAIDTPVIAADADAPDRVSLSFGLLEVSELYLVKRSIELSNFADEAWSGSISVSNTLANAGVTLTPAKPKVTVPAKGSATVELTLAIDPAKAELAFDPTTPPEVKGGPRHIAHEASGQVWFHGESRSVHVPYHMVLRPVGDQRMEAKSVKLPQREGLATVALPIAGDNPHSTPLVSVFQFGYLSPSRGYSNREQAARDLRAVGAASNASELGGIDNANLFFGIAMDGSWIVPQSFLTSIGIDVDTDLDGATDYELTHGSSGDVLASGDITERELADDAYHTIIDSFEFDKPKLGGILNVFPSAERETALLNNSVMIYSIKAADLGLTEGATRIQYRFHNVLETTRWIEFDAAKPALRTTNPLVDQTPYHAADRSPVVAVDHDALAANGFKDGKLPNALLLFHHNHADARYEVVRFVSSGPDTDQDDMSDDWETLHFSGLGVAGANSDFDGDSFADVAEYYAGTDPRDSGSFLHFTSPIEVKNETVVLRWQSVPGRRYRVEKSNGDPVEWQSVAKGLTARSDLFEHIDLRLDNGKPVFYRLVVEQD